MDPPPPIPPRPPGYELPGQQQQQQQNYYPPPSPQYPAAQQFSPQYASYQQQQPQMPPQQYTHAGVPPPHQPPSQYSNHPQYAQPGFSPPPQQHMQAGAPPPHQPPSQHPNHPQYAQPGFPPPPQQPSPQYPNHQQYATAGFQSPPQQPQPPPSNWNEHLFYSNGNPTPVFEAMMKEFFVRLDSQRTGYITPEAVTSFLDVCQVNPEEQVWKRCCRPSAMYAAEDMADFEFKAILEAFYFDHKVVVRNPQAKQLPYGGMALLSLAGFTDFMSVEFAGDPDDYLSKFNNALRHYGVWPDKGPIPRHVLPPTCPPELQRRVDEATVRCRNTSAQRINAQKTKAMIQARAGRAAVNLTSNNTYRYY